MNSKLIQGTVQSRSIPSLLCRRRHLRVEETPVWNQHSRVQTCLSPCNTRWIRSEYCHQLTLTPCLSQGITFQKVISCPSSQGTIYKLRGNLRLRERLLCVLVQIGNRDASRQLSQNVWVDCQTESSRHGHNARREEQVRIPNIHRALGTHI